MDFNLEFNDWLIKLANDWFTINKRTIVTKKWRYIEQHEKSCLEFIIYYYIASHECIHLINTSKEFLY